MPIKTALFIIGVFGFVALVVWLVLVIHGVAVE
jgi:hypothetical protein